MQSIRRFFVPGLLVGPVAGQSIKILCVGAGRRVRPHRSALQFVIGRTRQRCPDFSKHRHQGRELALVQISSA